jgi:fatty acid desaturase
MKVETVLAKTDNEATRKDISRMWNVAIWLSAGTLIIQFSMAMAIDRWHPSWMCKAINPGGKELICGAGYFTHWLSTETSIALAMTLFLYVVGVLGALQGKVGRRSKSALLALTLVMTASAAGALMLGGGDTP